MQAEQCFAVAHKMDRKSIGPVCVGAWHTPVYPMVELPWSMPFRRSPSPPAKNRPGQSASAAERKPSPQQPEGTLRGRSATCIPAQNFQPSQTKRKIPSGDGFRSGCQTGHLIQMFKPSRPAILTLMADTRSARSDFTGTHSATKDENAHSLRRFQAY